MTPADASAAAAAPPAPAGAPRRRAPLWARVLGSEYWVLGLCVLYLVALTPFVPELTSVENFQNLLSNALPLLAVAIGQTIVLVTGGIDLSVTSIIALASVGGAAVMTGDGSVLAGLGVMLALGAVVGLANGVAITRLAMPPFMVTLTMMMFVGGVAVWATKSRPIHGLPDGFTALGQGGLGPLPWALLIVGGMGVAAHLLLRRTVLGRWLYAVGMSAKTARVSGVPVPRVMLTAYVLSGLAAAVASVLYTARLETGSPVLGQRIFLDVIGAAVIGGTSLFGGKGTVLGTVFGVLFITVIDNSFNLLGLSSFVVLIAKGGVILLAAVLDALRHRVAAR